MRPHPPLPLRRCLRGWPPILWGSHMRTLAAAIADPVATLRKNLRFTTDPAFAARMLADAEDREKAEALREFVADRPLLRTLVEAEG